MNHSSAAHATPESPVLRSLADGEDPESKTLPLFWRNQHEGLESKTLQNALTWVNQIELYAGSGSAEDENQLYALAEGSPKRDHLPPEVQMLIQKVEEIARLRVYDSTLRESMLTARQTLLRCLPAVTTHRRNTTPVARQLFSPTDELH